LSNHKSSVNRVAIIAGTGFETAFDSQGLQQLVQTPYGDVTVTTIQFGEGELIFLPRHGSLHAVPPHRVNHLSHIWALHALDVRHILATSAVGSLRLDRLPGDIIVPDDLIDFRGQVTTFYNGEVGSVRHVDFSFPFSQKGRNILIQSAMQQNEKENSSCMVYPSGTYLCVSGPRYETPAEVRLFGSWGADVVGMTVGPEAILARELGLEYSALSVVTNLGTGLAEGPLEHGDVSHRMELKKTFVVNLFRKAAGRLLEDAVVKQ
jgi:5'-methylthioadenosine phosphorylase